MQLCKFLTVLCTCFVVFSFLSYRLMDWITRYQAMKNYFVFTGAIVERDGFLQPDYTFLVNRSDLLKPILTVPSRTPEVASYSDSSTTARVDIPGLTVTLCNLNPMRGSSLFAIQNGSNLYDFVTKVRQKEMEGKLWTANSDSDSTFISTDLLAHTSHRIEEMLKNCQSGDQLYTPRNFSSIQTAYGLCHMISLQPTVQQLRFLLDPQEYDYLIPNSGLTGFRIWIHASEDQARKHLQLDQNDAYTGLNMALSQSPGIGLNEVVVSSEFQTIVRVSLGIDISLRSQLYRDKHCHSKDQCPEADLFQTDRKPTDVLKERHQFRNEPTAAKSVSTRHISATSFDAQIISTAQATKSNLLYSLMGLRDPQLFQRNALTVAWAQRIQQRAYLRLANLTAFHELQKLVTGFADLQNELEKTTTQLSILQSSLWSDERVILQRQQVAKDCQLDMVQSIQQLSNITSKFHNELCQLPSSDGLYTGGVLRCEPTITNLEEPQNVDTNFIQAVFLLQEQFRHQKAKSFIDNERISGKKKVFDNLHRTFESTTHELGTTYLATSQPRVLELQVINLFFSSNATSPRLKDILRNYLRVLSAKRMQIRPRKVSSALQTRKVSLTDQAFMPDYEDLCSDELHDKFAARYHDFLSELGERIAACLQRLDAFVNSMNGIVQANKHLISAFVFPNLDLARIPQSSLVAFTIQVEQVDGGLSTSRVVSLDTVVNPFSEVLSICFATLGFLLPLLLLIDHAFKRMYRSNIRGLTNS